MGCLPNGSPGRIQNARIDLVLLGKNESGKKVPATSHPTVGGLLMV